MFTNLNLWAVLVSAVVYWVWGGIWYAAVFTKSWQKALGIDRLNAAEKARLDKDFPKALLAHFISGLLTSVALSYIVRSSQDVSFIGGMLCGFIAWLGFAFTLNLNSLMFEKRPMPVFLINNGFFLVAFAVIGGILAVWR